MRRSLCVVEPAVFLSGNVGTWKFTYAPMTELPKGTKLKFDLQTQNRPWDWQSPQTNLQKKSNLIWGQLPNGKVIPAQAINLSEFEFTLPVPINIGENFAIFIGTPLKAIEKEGNRVQTYTQRKKTFHLYIDPKGKGNYKEAEVFTADIRGNDLKKINIITPSIVARNRRFDVIVRFEDKFGNLTARAPEGTLIDLTYENFRENLHWKLFVPETGFLTLPNLYFNEAGIYSLKLTNMLTKEEFFSSPIKCFLETDDYLLWGALHAESLRFDAVEAIESCLRHVRDELCWHFYATSPFEIEEETNKHWKSITEHVAEFNEEERFVSFLGFQWVGSVKEEGLRHFIFSKDFKPLLKKKDLKHNSLKKIYKSHHGRDFISIPTFTMGASTAFDFKNFNPDFERVVEIYNAWGSSENSKKEGNFKPIYSTSKQGQKEDLEGSIINALNKNSRFGFVAGGFDDRGVYSNLYESDQEQYFPGQTAIFAPSQSREVLFQALYDRRCYATTGAKIILGLYVAQQPMGSELSIVNRPGLAISRFISFFVIGTKKITKIDLIRSGKIFKTFTPNSNVLEMEMDDTDPETLATIQLKDQIPFCYYYLRVYQEDGHMAWSSPIWIDFGEDKNKKINLEKAKPLKALKKEPSLKEDLLVDLF